jgi:uncharacterized Zn-finger protein
MQQKRPCTQEECKVTHKDLPLCCPMPASRLWDGHPRVYLPIAETGKEKCPYCGTVYILTDFDEKNGH